MASTPPGGQREPNGPFFWRGDWGRDMMTCNIVVPKEIIYSNQFLVSVWSQSSSVTAYIYHLRSTIEARSLGLEVPRQNSRMVQNFHLTQHRWKIHPKKGCGMVLVATPSIQQHSTTHRSAKGAKRICLGSPCHKIQQLQFLFLLVRLDQSKKKQHKHAGIAKEKQTQLTTELI